MNLFRKSLKLEDVIRFEKYIPITTPEPNHAVFMPNSGIYVEHLTLDPREAGEELNMLYALHRHYDFFVFAN
jgi:hypothetical protein